MTSEHIELFNIWCSAMDLYRNTGCWLSVHPFVVLSEMNDKQILDNIVEQTSEIHYKIVDIPKFYYSILSEILPDNDVADDINNTIQKGKKEHRKSGHWLRIKSLISLLNKHNKDTTPENEKQKLLDKKIIKKVSKGHYKIIDMRNYYNYIMSEVLPEFLQFKLATI